MAFDRYDTRHGPRGERPRWAPENRDRDWQRGRGDYDRDFDRDRGERGFFERARDEISSWFGDEDDRRERDWREREWNERGRGPMMSRERDEDRGSFWRDRSWDRDDFERDERFRPSERSFRGERERGYRPITGDYGRSERESGQFFAASGYGRARDPERDYDPHYRSWRDRHLSELDRDYDEYRREHQSKFESDFGSWREKRQAKRGLLGQIREHMEVVGSDDQHVGKVDKVAGDRIILAKSDPESGGSHHSLTCMDVDRIEGDRVILGCTADQARERWRDEDRSRALFEPEDQGEAGPHILDRSFEGTYR